MRRNEYSTTKNQNKLWSRWHNSKMTQRSCSISSRTKDFSLKKTGLNHRKELKSTQVSTCSKVNKVKKEASQNSTWSLCLRLCLEREPVNYFHNSWNSPGSRAMRLMQRWESTKAKKETSKSKPFSRLSHPRPLLFFFLIELQLAGGASWTDLQTQK